MEKEIEGISVVKTDKGISVAVHTTTVSAIAMIGVLAKELAQSSGVPADMILDLAKKGIKEIESKKK